MRVVVIGGTGQIGLRVVSGLQTLGHSVLAASPGTGVDIISGDGLAAALVGAEVVIDVTNKVAMDRDASVSFFETAARNILTAEIGAGVRHHLALSVLNSERLSDSGYIAGKLAQESYVRSAPVPYTLVHAAQFFELVPMMIQMLTTGGVARLPHALFQPIAAQEVADALVHLATGAPVNGRYQIAGPEIFRIDELAARYVRKTGGSVRIEADPHGTYFGAPLTDDILLPDEDAHLQWTTFDDWLATQDVSSAA